MADRRRRVPRWLLEPIGLTGAGITALGLTLLILGWQRWSGAIATLGLGLAITGALQIAGAAGEHRRSVAERRKSEGEQLDELRRLVLAALSGQQPIGPIHAATIMNAATYQHRLIEVDDQYIAATWHVAVTDGVGHETLTRIMGAIEAQLPTSTP
jgi:hypothetical protein